MNLQCIITDDEPIALEIMEDYINMVPGLSLIAKCKNAMETLAALRKQKADILFVDIKMPGVTGLELVRSLKHPPAIIFTTAYANFALDGFDIDATDYLLKPISVDRFLKAINKVFNQTVTPELYSQKTIGQKNDFLFIKSGKGLIKINYTDIFFVEAMENYVRIHLKDRIIFSAGTLKDMEEALPNNFVRIHPAYIVNLEKADSVQDHIFSLGNKNLPIGKSYKKSVFEILKKHQLVR